MYYIPPIKEWDNNLNLSVGSETGIENSPLCQIFLTEHKKQLNQNNECSQYSRTAEEQHPMGLAEHLSPNFPTITLNLKENNSC